MLWVQQPKYTSKTLHPSAALRAVGGAAPARAAGVREARGAAPAAVGLVHPHDHGVHAALEVLARRPGEAASLSPAYA